MAHGGGTEEEQMSFWKISGIVVALLVLTISACGGTQGGDATTPEPEATEGTEAEPVAEPTEGEATAGPIDGSWGNTTLTCDGEANPQIPQMTINAQNDTGTFVMGFGPTCVVTMDESYTYGEGTVTTTPTAMNCEPNDGCGAVFGGAECMPGLPPAHEWTYAVEGDVLTFTKTSEGPPMDNCPAGTQEVYTMHRQ